MNIHFNEAEEFILTTEEPRKPELFGFMNACLTLDSGNDAELFGAAVTSSSHLMVAQGREQTADGFKVCYRCAEKKVDLYADVTVYEGISAVSQKAILKNCDEIPVRINQIGANVNEVCYDGGDSIAKRLSDGSILLHFCQTKWQGEGQWNAVTPADFGVYTTTTHPWERTVARLDSASSWSTSAYYPLLIIEDKKKNECWFFEIEGGQSWFFEVYACSGHNTRFLSIKMGGADERLAFSKVLATGEEYTTASSFVYGVVKGGFDEAVKELTKYKRKTTVAPNGCPLVFNDYMNCNWACESRERLIGLIDRAAEAGAEIFCIDDGWQTEQGLWFPDDKKFSDGGVQGILDRIRSKGMKAGVWFEFEMTPVKLKDLLGADDLFLFRDGSLVAPWRPLGNFRSQALLKYLNERVDALYAMGVRFIKNDHNNNESVGTTIYGESAGEGLEKNAAAFLAFIDGLRERYPDLVIENCGSGAMRSDWGTLKHFSVQSTSDQEDYVTYVSVLTGSLALMPPEKAGIWVYPYPLDFDDREIGVIPPEKLPANADGERTVFNMVNGMLGAAYLSGRLDQMDEKNYALFKEGVTLYKSLYPFICSAYPVFPTGRKKMYRYEDNAAGLLDENGENLLLAVWNLSDEAREVAVDLKKYAMTSAELIYPSEIGDFSHEYEKNVLVCRFEKGKQARLFKLKK
ncbi:MAG: alpha-galactosidase [Clostridia bacterium]|nr:alpha-galactosidase [Clostridia bacterium]